MTMLITLKTIVSGGRIAFLFLSSYVQGYGSCAENYKRHIRHHDITKHLCKEVDENINDITRMIDVFYQYT